MQQGANQPGLREENQLDVRDEFDVIVAGGGIAGVAAALAARRLGARTLLLEKSTMLGGLATLGLVAIYLPLCDGKGRQVTAGIAEELLHASGKYGFNTVPDCWKGEPESPPARYCTDFSPAAFAVALDAYMEDEGVELALDTLVCRPIWEGGRCTHIVVENKSGRYAYACRTAVDATGDADLFRYADVRCERGENGLTYWSYVVDPEILQTKLVNKSFSQDAFLFMGGANEYGVGGPDGYGMYDGTDDRQVTRFLLDGRRCLCKEVYGDGRNKHRTIMSLPAMAQFRTTRRIVGAYELHSDDVNRSFPDAVGCVGDWRYPGPVWEIPYRALYAERCTNLFAAGRCISADSEAWQATRVIPGAAVSGQAAGTAAALCAKQVCDAARLPIDALQQTLQDNGVLLHAKQGPTAAKRK